MRILQFVPYFIPYNGGQERYVYNLSRHLVKMGHEVHVITSNYPESKEYEVIDGITVERYRCLARPLRNPIVPSFLTINGRIKDFDVIHTHNEHSSAAMAAAYLRRKNNIPLVLTCHGQLRFGNIFADTFEKIYSRSIGRILLDTCDKIVTLSDSDKQYVSNLGVDDVKITILPNAIDPDELESFKPRDVSQKYNLDGKRIVLFVGPVIKRKGVEYLIRAIPKVSRGVRDEIIFVFTGSGDFIEEAKRLSRELKVGDKVLFTGLIDFEELIGFYRSSDIFVLPSMSEGLPTSILEAMYFSLPVITTDIPGVRDHFKDTALLVPPKDEDKLAETLIKLLGNDELRKRLSKSGEKLVRDKYTWDIVAKNYGEIYKNLMER